MDSKEVFFTISMNDMKGLDDFTEGLKKVLKERLVLPDLVKVFHWARANFFGVADSNYQTI